MPQVPTLCQQPFPFLSFLPTEKKNGFDDQSIKSADEDVRAAISSESRMQGAVRRVTTTAALANAEGPLGAWAMGLHGFLAEVRRPCWS